MSVRVKLILVLTAILVGAFISLSVFNYNVSRQNARDEMLNSALPLTRDNIYSEIQAGLMRPLFVSSLMANDTFLKDWTKSGETDVLQIMRYLDEIKNKYGFFSSFFVSAKSGKYFYSQGILKVISPRDSRDDWFYKFINSNAAYDLNVDNNEADKNILTIFINHRVEDKDGNLLGVTGVGLKMDNVSKLLKSFSEKYSKMIFLVDPQGTVQAHHEVYQIEHTNIKDVPGLSEIADQVLATVYNDPATYECVVDGEKILLTARYIPELEWFLIVEQRESEMLQSARGNFQRTLIIGGLATVLIVILSIFTVNYFQLRLEKQANTDELTGVANRRAFEIRVGDAINTFFKTGKLFSIILLDVDCFKQVNDLYGHIEGDAALKKISTLITGAIREIDMCARWGGDEFIILVAGDGEQAVAIAERIRSSVDSSHCCEKCAKTEDVKITVSCGVAQYAEGDSLDSLTRRADQAMYESKKQGRNVVVKA
ncbi:sensor domain-containing diguanylate cyclase [Maridesulfovibrio hydrothermalis]|uniref:diguanylate cyclase n=1 Tax=Maridesulfovibrio hydrothermalis AM13 = DSM 14728 TaxID=1121451 RepID=L0RF43_9BACT|nr:sensor domain-containing diguanylate cyclase [Maridesulfovibrio hydrothermalis]CCO25374.1 Diguanylate cyclase [Maridesulfovibrio hydrothermalis AM13 = DSM 14728]